MYEIIRSHCAVALVAAGVLKSTPGLVVKSHLSVTLQEIHDDLLSWSGDLMGYEALESGDPVRMAAVLLGQTSICRSGAGVGKPKLARKHRARLSRFVRESGSRDEVVEMRRFGLRGMETQDHRCDWCDPKWVAPEIRKSHQIAVLLEEIRVRLDQIESL